MKIIKPDGTVEIRESIDPRRKWSPTEILALDLPADSVVVSENSLQRRETSAQIKEKRAKRAKAARQTKKGKKKGEK